MMRQQLIDLRRRMAEENIDAYLILSDDFHGSEYVGDYFKSRAFLSGFTGSAGTLIVTQDFAGLWTDGRYFLQAGQQLQDSGITLCKMGEPDVPTEDAFLAEHLQNGQCLGFDGRAVPVRRFHALQTALAKKEIHFRTDIDLAGEIWTDRPPLSAEPVWELSKAYAGRSRTEKFTAVRQAMAKQQADVLLISSLDDIAWLLNLRGNDVACSPVFLSYLAMTADDVHLFLNPGVLTEDLKQVLNADGVSIAPYFDVFSYAAALPAGDTVWLDEEKTSCALYKAAAKGSRTLVTAPNPTAVAKAVKNATEVENMRLAHLHDGIALTKFIFWLKTNVGKIPMTERSCADYLEQLRKAQPHYLGPSFAPILAYGPHAALPHYSATEESDAVIQPEGFLLADTGGHYLEGTTDVTRTFAVGPLTEEMRLHYTTVLRSHLALLFAQFPAGCRGSALDMLARQPLWATGLDYNHGTGHGVGYLLNVHEGPNSFRFRSAGQDAVLQPGMITSDEPGLYFEGRYGIRLENLIVCEDRFTNEYGHFLGFAALTLAPFDRDAIAVSLLSPTELAQLNAYHAAVYETLVPHLSEGEARWLKDATAAL